MNFMATVRVLWERLQRAVNSLTRSELLTIIGGIAAAVAIFLFVTLGDAGDLVQHVDMDGIRHRDYLIVGVRDDVPSFSYRDRDGNYIGLEADIARAMAKRIFDDETKVEFIPVNHATRTSMLSTGMVDCVIALCEQGYTSTAAFSTPYYTDAVGVVCNSNTVSSFETLKHKTIGAVMRAGEPVKQGALDVLREFGSDGPMFLNIVTYASGPDMARDAANGVIDGFALEGALIQLYYYETLFTLPEALGTERYAVAVPKDNSALLGLCNEVIASLSDSGTLAALYQRYSLPIYDQAN